MKKRTSLSRWHLLVLVALVGTLSSWAYALHYQRSNNAIQHQQNRLARSVCELTNLADMRINNLSRRQADVIAFLIAVTPSVTNARVRLTLLREYQLIQATPFVPIPILACPAHLEEKP